MRCTNCGAELNSGDKFCPYCGKAFKGEQQKKVNSYGGICPSCGKKNNPEDRFCAYCGASLPKEKYDSKAKYDNKEIHDNKERYAGSAVRHSAGEDRHRAAAGYNPNNAKYSAASKQPDDSEKVKTVIAVVGAVVIIVFVLTIGFILSSDGDKQDNITAGSGFAENISEETDFSLSGEEEDFSFSEAESAVSSENEEKIEQIREEYGDIVFNISNGVYDEIEISSGTKAYYSGSALQAVIISAGTDNSNYIKTYYYSNNELICAYYEGSDAQRFYFSGGGLLLQRYYPNASDAQTYTDYNADDNTWEATVLSEADNLKESWKNALLNANSESKTEENTQSSVEAYNPPTDSSESSGSASSSSGTESEMSELIYNYCSSLCSAINAGSYSIVSKYIASGSSLETSQRSLVSRLYSDGTTEELVSCNVTNVVSAGTSTYYVYVIETERINYVSKGTKTNTYNWKYTAVYSGGQWKLSNIEQA
ncbi:MAG: zinc ribbon domain-containing protein [Eubacterium sp.]|nr:zinc ribbon domain-containing protein [Eubacterium sp.]